MSSNRNRWRAAYREWAGGRVGAAFSHLSKRQEPGATELMPSSETGLWWAPCASPTALKVLTHWNQGSSREPFLS